MAVHLEAVNRPSSISSPVWTGNAGGLSFSTMMIRVLRRCSMEHAL
jgi:hypothetical protein